MQEQELGSGGSRGRGKGGGATRVVGRRGEWVGGVTKVGQVRGQDRSG